MLGLKNLAEGQLPIAKTTLYTVPAATNALAVDFSVVTTHTSDISFNFYFKKSGSVSRRISPEDQILIPGDHYQRRCRITMATGDQIEGDASVAAVADYVVSGLEVT